MTIPSLSSETLHVSAVAIAGRAVLIGGRSGSGKSDLALRLIDRGAALISDDYTTVRRSRDGVAHAAAPERIAGQIEVRGVGIVTFDAVSDVPVALFVDLDTAPERLPDPGEQVSVAGVRVPLVALDGREPSAPLKVEAALRLLGLPAG